MDFPEVHPYKPRTNPSTIPRHCRAYPPAPKDEELLSSKFLRNWSCPNKGLSYRCHRDICHCNSLGFHPAPLQNSTDYLSRPGTHIPTALLSAVSVPNPGAEDA